VIRTRVTAVLAATVLGVAGGVATAVVTAEDGATPYADPLGIGSPMVNLECTGEPVLVIANGEAAPALVSAISNLPEDERSQAPTWVAYLGPGSRRDLCLDRMAPHHQGDNVTFLNAGSTVRATCLCEVGGDDAPRLYPGMPSDSGTVIWVKALQNMFVSIDEDRRRPPAEALTEDDLTGQYDERTVARVKHFGEATGNRTDGIVDAQLWKRIKDSGCSDLEY
jgi:hypothetical protein